MRRRIAAPGLTATGLIAACCAACGSSASTSASTPTSTSPAMSAPASSPGARSSAAPSPTCADGWSQPQPGSDLYRQASSALQQAEGGPVYVIKTVRYFTGPVPGGGVGAIYYLDVADNRLAARVLLASGSGPPVAAVAKPETSGWKAGDWTGFRGDQPPAAHPGVPGRWGGPTFDPVRGTPPLLAPSLAGCLDGT